MEDNNKDASVYDLVTNLCEKFSNNQCVVKKLRGKCFEVLLGKKAIKNSQGSTKGPDTFYNVLAWQFTLATKFGLVTHGLSLKEFAEYVQECYGEDVLKFIMCLRNEPTVEDEFTDISDLSNFNIFPISLKNSFSSIYTPPIGRELQLDNESNSERGLEEESSSSDSLWGIVSKERYNNHSNWENFGHVEPLKEKPFLSELGNSCFLWVENLPSVYFSSIIQDQVTLKPQIKTITNYVKDVRHLLVGLASYTFGYNENNEFKLTPGILVEGLSPEILNSLSDNFILSGNCYKALHNISFLKPLSGGYKEEGYIFTELCESIWRFLEFYRSSVINLPESIGLLELFEYTKQLRNNLKIITAICKVGPYSESEKILHGVSLLNYLYQTALNLTDKNILLVLYSILFPCCQVYFNRFLKQWLLEGIVNDPYEEFFVKPSPKYISTRGRTYWTRSYILREDIVPDFLVDLRMDILNCGKAMNLLKLCGQSSKLCLYLMGKKPHIVSCCLTSEQLTLLEQNAANYYLEVSSECGPQIKLDEIVRKEQVQDPIFMNLIAKKRALSLKRLELERKKRMEEETEKKLEDINYLMEQYDLALLQKQMKIASDIESEIKSVEFSLSVENLRHKLIEKEANHLINYYNELYKQSENRKRQIEKHIDHLKSVSLDQPATLESHSSEESFYSIEDQDKDEVNLEKKIVFNENTMHSSKSLDLINANSNEKCDDLTETTLRNFEIAYKMEETILKEELGILVKPMDVIVKAPKIISNKNLTDAQKNKIRVLSTELGIEVQPCINKFVNKTLSQSEINRNTIMGSNQCFYSSYVQKKVDNDNFINKNEKVSNKIIDNQDISKKSTLSLDFNKLVEPEKPTPMSVDSTPLSDTTITSGSKVFLSLERTDVESLPTTACTEATDEGFHYDEMASNHYVPGKKFFWNDKQKLVFSKRVSHEEASGLSTNCLKLFLHESISIPLATQGRLVDNELLRHFVCNLQYLKHLTSLRSYFFLQDGEFGRNITENLFEKLYDVHFPIELMNCRTLQNLVLEALQSSSKYQENQDCVSFKVNSLPKRFHLGDPDVLDCLSLTYNVKWPLNILLPVDAIAKYDEVFKYLIKLSRISWVLKKIFLALKILAKESGRKEIYLMVSPHFRRLHQCRHVMLHFIQTLQNYITGEVLQPSWKIFEKNLSNVTNPDSLYALHTAYIKNILFLCLLNKKSVPLKKVIQKIFIVILKFYDHLRSRDWTCENGVYIHPNFTKLENIFLNFEEFVLYLFKVGRKVARSGYQPHLSQLLDMLDVNGYYSAKKYVNVT